MQYQNFVTVLSKEIRYTPDWQKVGAVLHWRASRFYDHAAHIQQLQQDHNLSTEDATLLAAKIVHWWERNFGLFDVDCALNDMLKRGELTH